MKTSKRLTVLLLTILSMVTFGSYAKAEVVIFPDAALEAVIREQLDIPTGDIESTHLEGIEILDASGKGIIEITGIGHCINLEALDLSDNTVMDVSTATRKTQLNG